MRARRRSAIVLFALCAAIATPAQTQAGPKQPQPVVVLRDGALALTAHDDDGSLCLGVLEDGRDEGEGCNDPERGVIVATGDVQIGEQHIGLAVPASAARVELRRAGRPLAAATAVDGPAYTGRFAGRLRFALARLPAGTHTDGLRAHVFDAAGVLVAVIADSDGDRIFDHRRVLSGRSGGVRWSLASSRSSALTPSVADLAHESLSRCLELNVQTPRGGDHSRECRSDAPRESLLQFGSALTPVALEDRCDPAFRLLHGRTRSSVRAVTVLLGDGRRVRARSAQLPGGEEQAYALVIGRESAVRRVEIHERSGRTQVLRQAAAPLVVACAGGTPDTFLSQSSFAIDFFTSPFGDLPAVTPLGPATTLPGSPAMRVADGPADTLCLALGTTPFNALGCAIVSPDLEEPLVTLDNFLKPLAIAFALPARVATVRIAGPNGRGTRDIPTVAGDGYAGIYAGHVRFAATTIADQRELNRLDLLDAAGTVLHSEPPATGGSGWTAYANDVRRSPPARRIAGRAGAPSLWQSTLRFGGQRERCLTLTAGAPPPANANCSTTRAKGAVLLDVPCTTRRLTVAIALPGGGRALADTGGPSPRPLALRDGAGLLTLAPGTPLRSLTIVRKGRAQRVPIDAPPGRRQCGWRAVPAIASR